MRCFAVWDETCATGHAWETVNRENQGNCTRRGLSLTSAFVPTKAVSRWPVRLCPLIVVGNERLLTEASADLFAIKEYNSDLPTPTEAKNGPSQSA